MLETLVGRNQCSFVHLSVHLWAFQFDPDFSCLVVNAHRGDLNDSCRVAINSFMVAEKGWLLGWYTEVRDLKLRRIAELNEVSYIARRSLIESVA